MGKSFQILLGFSSETHTMIGLAENRLVATMVATCKIAPFQPVASIGGLLSVRQRGGLGAGVVSDQLCFISIVRKAGAVLCLRLLTQLSLALRSHILKTPSHPRIKGFQRRMHISVKGIFIFSNILVVALRIYLAQ